VLQFWILAFARMTNHPQATLVGATRKNMPMRKDIGMAP
jgi:hypothetical protein